MPSVKRVKIGLFHLIEEEAEVEEGIRGVTEGIERALLVLVQVGHEDPNSSSVDKLAAALEHHHHHH